MNSTAASAHLIAIDWGTSNFRAFLLNMDGVILQKRFAKRGVLRIRYGTFAKVLDEEIGDWLLNYPNLPVLMSGMVGSRQGWQEVPYLECPVNLDQLANHLQVISYENRKIWVVPGLKITRDDLRIDVMRGEETQVVGTLAVNPDVSQVFCLPGTHSKWAWVEAGRLYDFTTYMTGEIFTLLAKHSILGKLMRGFRTDYQAFDQGLMWAAQSGNLLSQLFQVRTQVLAGNLANTAVHSFLSGVLIGYEIEYALKQKIPGNKVAIIANARIADFYARALSKNGVEALITDADRVTSMGLLRIAKWGKLCI